YTAFEIVALGQRWGFTENNGRRKMSDSTPIGFVFTPAKEGDRVAPAFIDVYEADWVAHPGEP
ncbi:MAG: hypothetical protein O7B26_07320, partial [Planctomycetota bacterium]|nr:hypothetical protein [Planctomycetota bacterium]